MKALKIALFLMPLLLLSGCGTLKKNTESENTKVIYIETEKIVMDTVTVEVPVEVTMTYSGLRDTLKMETSIARAEAYIDENEMQLVGSIENKPAQIEKVVPLKYKTIIRDSLIFQTKNLTRLFLPRVGFIESLLGTYSPAARAILSLRIL